MARGFGVSHGVSTTDLLVTGYTAHATQRTWAVWTFRAADGGGSLGRVFDKNNTTTAEFLFNNSGSGTYGFGAAWSGGTGQWEWTRPSLSTWSHQCIAYDAGSAANNPTVYQNAVLQSPTRTSTPSGSRTTNAFNYTLGGRQVDASRNWDGFLAEFAMWDAILTADEMIALGKGFAPPLVRPQSLVYYAPLIRNAVDLRNGSTVTLTGTAPQPHPRVYYGTAPLYTHVSAADAGLSAALAEGDDTLSAALTAGIAVASAVLDAADTASAALTSAIVADAAITEGANTCASAAVVATVADAALSEAADTAAAVVTNAVLLDAAMTEGADTVTAALTVAVVLDAALAEDADTLAATLGAEAIVLDASLAESDDSVTGDITGEISVAASLVESADGVTALGGAMIAGSAAVQEAADHMAAQATLLALLDVAFAEGADTLVATIGEEGVLADDFRRLTPAAVSRLLAAASVDRRLVHAALDRALAPAAVDRSLVPRVE